LAEALPRSTGEKALVLTGEVIAPTKAAAKTEDPDTEHCRAIWGAYSDAYGARYGASPVRNAKRNGQVRELLKRLGANDAPMVAEFYLSVSNTRIVQSMHDFGLLVANAEGFQTQWLTGRRMTAGTAQHADRAQTVSNTAAEALEIYERMQAQKHENLN
jgi:hypothetical protein